jgi:phenylalanyl-tRNA synthetase beta chain
MPKITLDYKTVKKSLNGKISDEDLKYKISMLGTDLDDFSKEEIVVEVFPNRPDMLGEFGFIRAMNTFLGFTSGLKKYEVKKSNEKVIIHKSVAKVRPYTVCAIVKNLKLNDEKIRQIIQLQEKLHVTYCRNRKRAAIGIYPSEKIKYPIHFFADKPKNVKFIPLGESREMDGLQILSKHKTGREFGHLLEGKDLFPFFKDAKNNILSMPPVINSDSTGKVSDATKEVFIECSGFDMNVLTKLLNIIVCELADMGGEIYSMELDYGKKMITPNLDPEEMKLDESYVLNLLGCKIPIKENLGKMGLGYVNKKALIPAYRTDILHQMDLVEEIAIGYGYDNFESELPQIATVAEEKPLSKFNRKVREVLVGLGFLELSTLHVSSEVVHLTKMRREGKLIKMANSKSSEYDSLREFLLPSIMEVFERNADKEYPQLIFDIGYGFKKNNSGDTGIKESQKLCVGIAGKDFTKAKQVLENLLRNFGLSCTLKEHNDPAFIEGRVGQVIVNKKVIGIIGEIHPGVLLNFKLETPINVFEINLEDVCPQS